MSTESINGDQSAEDVLKLLDSLDKEATTAAGSSGAIPATSGTTNKDDGEDILGFLDSLTDPPAKASDTKTETPSGPVEPTRTVNKTSAPAPAPVPAPASAPAPVAAAAPSQPVDHSVPDPISSITSWWSKNKTGLWDTATSAVKQAEARVRELQPDHRGIDSLGDSLSKFKFDRNLIQSTLSSIVDTIAPPLERHEQLQIHVFHDMVGYPAIDGIVYSVFERVMDQVEGGGELTLVVQKGKERHRRGSVVEKRELGVFRGSLEQGQKLAKASIDEFLLTAASTDKAKPTSEDNSTKEEQQQEEEETTVDENGIVSKRRVGTEKKSESRMSNIYLSIQPVSADADKPNTTSGPALVGVANSTPAPTIISSSSPHAFQFIVYLSDPEHNINFSTVSQSFPLQWAEWLDSPDSAFESGSTNATDESDSKSTSISADPREWVIDWVEEGLGLSVGVVAQTYVSKRMGLSVLPPSRAPTPSVK